MNNRDILKSIASNWISLWTPPVNWVLYDTLHAEQFEDCSSAGRPSTKEGFALGLKMFINAFPDVSTSILDVVVDEASSKIAIRWSATGTNKERYLGVGPTERSTRITGIEIIEVENGKIIRRWGEWDTTDHLKKGG